MESVIYSLPVKLVGLLLLTGWSLVVGWKAVFRDSLPRFSAALLLAVSFGLFIAIRLVYLPDREQNVDTSTWIATALTVGQADDPLYTLLNYSDGRPLAVLPLAVVEWLGIPLDYGRTDLLGVLLWCLTLGLFWRILKPYTGGEVALLLIWLPILVLSTIWDHDFGTFNTEITGNLWLTLGLFWILRLHSKSALAVLGIGFWLGWLPFVKFQTVPMGVVLGLYASWQLVRHQRFAALVSLVGGALLPVLLLTIFYASHHDLASFWGDYFSNYFVYSYTSEYSDLSPWMRFSPVRIGRFLFHSYRVFLYWIAVFGGILVGFGLLLRRSTALSSDQKNRLWLGGFWLLASLYAALQAGNPYPHYLLFLIFPGLFLLALCSEFLAFSTARMILAACLAIVLAQAGLNSVFRKPISYHPGEPLFHQIAAEIRQRSQPNESLVLWGYLDRLHVYARRPMGYRNSNTFWVYYPTSTQEFRMKEFLHDMEQNKPRLFVDVMSPRISMFTDNAFHFEDLPTINAYIRQHYRLVKTIEDVRVFERKELPPTP